MKINPVIVAIPTLKITDGKKKVAYLRKTSREALRVSAYLSGITLKKLEKNSLGAPLPFNGIHWSVSHTSSFAAAVLGDYPIGIDVEKIKPRSEGVMEKIISPSESRLCREEKLHYFFRVWTAKEAVLKAEGIGLPGLSKCRVTDAEDKSTMFLDYDGKDYKVSQMFIDEHVISLVIDDNTDCTWALLER